MKSAKIFVCVLLVLLLFAPANRAASEIVLTHVTVIDTTGGSPKADQTVIIRGSHIASVEPSANVTPPKSARVIDAHGRFLIPGLWDMHVHIAGLAADPIWSKHVLLPLLLANGITGVRDMGGDLSSLLEWKREIEGGSLLAPNIVAAGPFLTAGGRKAPEQLPVTNVADARAAVRELKNHGADFIKIISLPSKEVFFAVADECKKQNIPFVGHLPMQVSAAEASSAGMRSIEHLFYSAFSLSLSSKEEELRPRLVEAERKGDSAAWEQIQQEADATYSKEKAAALFATLKKNGTWVTPTLTSLDISGHPENWKMDDTQLAFVPSAISAQWRTSLSDPELKSRAAWLARQGANDWKLTGELHRAGIPLLVGSDSLDPFVIPGDSLHQELSELVRAGLTPAEALQAATRGAAQFLGREKDFGSIEKGKRADLVLLAANPLENIANTRKIDAVIRNGKYLDRVALDKLLDDAKSAAANGK
ncbi:MAG TPA: amidohydrolase family protein [Candidatus Acidoferrum sp.]|jgi:imidazolonepropionase-like amidohydrolase